MYHRLARACTQIPSLMAGPITATLDALTAGNLGMLQLLRARELMQENIESRRHLEQQAYEALRSWRTTVLIAPVLTAAATALVFAVRLASPNATFVEIVVPYAIFFAMLLGVVLVGCHHVRQLPGAQTVVYASNSVRWNVTNAKALFFRAVNLLQLTAITLAPFNLELQGKAARASQFTRQLLRLHILPLLDATLLRFGVLSPAIEYWSGCGIALLCVCSWLLVYRRVLIAHDVKEEREKLYRAPLLDCVPSWAWRPSLTGAFNLLSDELLVFTATKLFAAVHCTRHLSAAAAGGGEGRRREPRLLLLRGILATAIPMLACVTAQSTPLHRL